MLLKSIFKSFSTYSNHGCLADHLNKIDYKFLSFNETIDERLIFIRLPLRIRAQSRIGS